MVRTTGGSEVVTTAILQRRQSFAQSGNQTKDTITCTASTTTTLNGIYMQTQCEPYIGPGPQFLRLNSIQPYTIVFPVTSPQLNNLLVQEVIDTLSEQLPNKLMNSLKGVRLIGGNCFLSFSNQPDAEYVLHLPLTLRGLPVLLEDASIGTTVLSLNGVPHNIDDDTVISVLSNFGNIVGGVERRLYKGVDTGERLVRLKARVSVPQTLWIGGCKASLRVLSDTEITSLALTRRKSFRSHINVHLQPLCFEQTDSKQFPFEHNIVSTPSVSTAQDIIDVYMVSPDSTTQREQGTLLQKKTEAPTPFIFPTVPQYSSTPNLPVQEIRQTGNITLNSLRPGSPDTFHIRSHSTPPCASNLSKTEISNSQPNTPASPVIYKRSSQRHRASKKVPKVNVESKKLTAECSQSSSSGQDSPTKPEKRRASVYFKREKQGNSILSRTTSSEQGDRNTGDITTTCSERERSNSDVSSRISICKRKMSTTGRETGKVPWCGCWGNGCI